MFFIRKSTDVNGRNARPDGLSIGERILETQSGFLSKKKSVILLVRSAPALVFHLSLDT